MKLARTVQVAAITLAALASCGCEGVRSMFQMSSDAPVPFFGLDFTLPNKLAESDVDDTSGKFWVTDEVDPAAAVVRLTSHQRVSRDTKTAEATDVSHVVTAASGRRSPPPYRPGTELAHAETTITPPAF